MLEAYLAVGVLPQTVLEQVKERLAAKALASPPGYRLEFGGEAAKRDESVGNLMAHVSLVAVLLVAVLVLSFHSFRLAGIVTLVAIQSAGLGLLWVWLLGYPFGFTVIIALLGLMGLAINAAIVILAELRADPLAQQGNLPQIRDLVAGCSRHIVSTTITTVGGFIPLLLGAAASGPPSPSPSPVAQRWRPCSRSTLCRWRLCCSTVAVLTRCRRPATRKISCRADPAWL